MGGNGMVNWELGPGLRSAGLPNKPETSALDAVADHAGECQARWTGERATKQRGVAREHAWLGVPTEPGGTHASGPGSRFRKTGGIVESRQKHGEAG